jgi:hypothetical protein
MQVVRVTRLNPHCRQGPVDCRKEDSPIWDGHSMAGDAVDRLQERRQPWVAGEEEHRRRVAVGAGAAACATFHGRRPANSPGTEGRIPVENAAADCDEGLALNYSIGRVQDRKAEEGLPVEDVADEVQDSSCSHPDDQRLPFRRTVPVHWGAADSKDTAGGARLGGPHEDHRLAEELAP